MMNSLHPEHIKDFYIIIKTNTLTLKEPPQNLKRYFTKEKSESHGSYAQEQCSTSLLSGK